ncbi:MAG: hypothetical protein WCK29_04240 [archaeon]
MSLKQILDLANENQTRIDTINPVYSLNKDSHARHIINNLRTPINTLSQLAAENPDFSDPELEATAKKNMDYLNRYLALMDKSFSFARAELCGQKSRGQYGFPDIALLTTAEAKAKGYETPALAYIALSEKRLLRL